MLRTFAGQTQLNRSLADKPDLLHKLALRAPDGADHESWIPCFGILVSLTARNSCRSVGFAYRIPMRMMEKAGRGSL